MNIGSRTPIKQPAKPNATNQPGKVLAVSKTSTTRTSSNIILPSQDAKQTPQAKAQEQAQIGSKRLQRSLPSSINHTHL